MPDCDPPVIAVGASHAPDEHGKAHNKAVTAVARELSGFLWAALREHEPAKRSGASVGG